MGPLDSLVVTAVVTDPQGIAQVVGGTLKDPGGGTYGAFIVSTVSGAYSLTLSWDAIETVRDITAPAGGQMRTFLATFYDQGGHSTAQSFDILLWCGDPTYGICSGGNCADFQGSTSTCGSCSKSCMGLSSYATCKAGVCVVNLGSSTPESCNALCASSGDTCVNGGTANWTRGLQQTLDCATVPALTDAGSFNGMSCTCTR
jgi:hypothetical protein